jgi:hypothetical protein
MRVRTRVCWSIAGAILLLTGGCTPPGPAVKPPREAVPLAVLPFMGEHGEDLRAAVEAMLTRLDYGGKPAYIVVERGRIDDLLRETDFATSGLVDDSTAAHYGRQLGATRVLLARVGRATKDSRRFTEEQRQCTREEKRGGLMGKLGATKCVDHRSVTVSCVENSVSVAASVRMVSVETGQILFADTVQGTGSSRACGGTGGLASPASLLEAAKTDLVASLQEALEGRLEGLAIPLKDDTQGLSADQAERFTGAVAFAQSGRLDRACQTWTAIEQEGGHTVPVLYNLGVCAELSGDHGGAFLRYRQADQRLVAPDEDLNTALYRVNRAMAKARPQTQPTAGLALPTPVGSDAELAEAQRLLHRLGYNPGPADGELGPRTRRAIEAFQRVNGLPRTGQVDAALMDALRGQAP